MYSTGAATADRTGPASGAASRNPLAWAFAKVVKLYRFERTVRELDSLDDRMLKDIGIRRGTVFTTARALSDYPRY